MITTIKQFKFILEKKQNNKDLIIVDVQEEFKKYFGEKYLKALEDYCRDFTRVYQIFDSNEVDHPDYHFPNQMLAINKEYGVELLEEDLTYYFDEPTQEIIKYKFENGFTERDKFKTIQGLYYVYIDGQHEWFICDENLLNLIDTLKKTDREIILVGGAENECLKDIYVTLKAFNINVTYDLQYVYSFHGSKYN